MTIDEAIKILHLVIDTPPSGVSQDFMEAQKLGIEALIRLKGNRQYPQMPVSGLLPGETPEEEAEKTSYTATSKPADC